MSNEIEDMIDEIMSELNQVKSVEQITTNLDNKTVVCKVCEEKDTWTCTEKFPNGSKKWRDSNNLICNGRVCGKCNRDRSRSTMKRIRGNRVYADQS